jgi:tripartite-type tricarboxylate transporter receptor subunit TctC
LAYIGALAINAGLYPDLPYDPLRDFSPITQLAAAPNVLVLHPSVAARNLIDFVALARTKPNQLNYSSGGVGTIGHLSAELLKTVASIDMQHIIYKGGGQAATAVLTGEVQAFFGGMSGVLHHAKAGKARLLAVTSSRRSPAAPDVPTIAESGYPGFEAVGWFGLVAPTGTRPDIVRQLNFAAVKAMSTSDVRERLGNVGFDIVTSTPEQFAAYIRSEVAKWKTLVKQIGLKPE